MFWFDKSDSRAVYVDKRVETVVMKDRKAKGGFQVAHIKPSVQANFISLPFRDGAYDMVVFDPPHLSGSGLNCWLTMRYGRLEGNWRTMIRKGFAECFRVLRQNGTLIFKWNETDVPVSSVLELTPHFPLIGNKCGKSAKTHWLVFIKSERAVNCQLTSGLILTGGRCEAAGNGEQLSFQDSLTSE
jgi:SAM-dependent methyltransferase